MGREVRVPRAEIERMVGKFAVRLLVLYGRVSGHGQKDDLETLFACFDVTLTVLEPGAEKTPEQELTDNLLALFASFSGRLYGLRSHKQKELLQCAQAVLTSP
jgi:putative resolvase